MKQSRISDKRELPPLILHPFGSSEDSSSLADRNLGLAPALARLKSRYAELCMLCSIGRDLNQWISECLEGAQPADGVTASSYISLLLFDAPRNVKTKMADWGVPYYQTIFSRALGLNLVYPLAPAPDAISESLLESFHVYADSLFDLRLHMSPGAELHGQDYTFDIFASHEYTQLLESEWANA